jgi:hypothetical protein
MPAGNTVDDRPLELDEEELDEEELDEDEWVEVAEAEEAKMARCWPELEGDVLTSTSFSLRALVMLMNDIVDPNRREDCVRGREGSP